MSRVLMSAARSAALLCRAARRKPAVSLLSPASVRSVTSFNQYRRVNRPSPSSSAEPQPTPGPPPAPSSSEVPTLADAIIPPLHSNALTTAVDLSRSARIDGSETQMVRVRLQPQQSIRAETGSLVYMTDGVTMQTGAGGGLSAVARRVMTGESALIVDLVNTGRREAEVGLSPEYPAKVVALHLAHHGGSVIAQRGAFLCGHSTVQIEIEPTRSLSAGEFGGGGFLLQRLSGEGSVMLKAGGAGIEHELEDGETIRAAPGSLVAMESTVSYDAQRQQEVSSLLLSGEGLSLLTLTGPGKVWLQSPPFGRVVAQVAARAGASAGAGMMVPVGAGGALTPQQQQQQGGMMSPFGFGGGGSMLGGLGSAMATGAAMGVGSEMAHRALGGWGHGGGAAPADPTPAPPPPPPQPSGSDSGEQAAGSSYGNDTGGYNAPLDEGMRSDLPPEQDGGGGGDGGWFGGWFGGEDDGGDDDGDFGDDE